MDEDDAIVAASDAVPVVTEPLVQDLREDKQVQTPLYGVTMAGPRWPNALGRQLERLAVMDGCCDIAGLASQGQNGESDDEMPTLEIGDDVTDDETDDDENGRCFVVPI
eukprot:g40548.t1